MDYKHMQNIVQSSQSASQKLSAYNIKTHGVSCIHLHQSEKNYQVWVESGYNPVLEEPTLTFHGDTERFSILYTSNNEATLDGVQFKAVMITLDGVDVPAVELV